ncbi:Guanosine-3',5'-bis(diphosphate) 3'-pyrophosphohydrolase MESH1 [Strongyloides ratti]|uniref:Guanosine-3',5'-bis(Diphosphate) 3'-pyrophosphohydrolase MESH1 n=1 Tax=Strongyloides ratti TaxID=34506 RepID=A0A090L4R1_STRRB|nr:Guanosine-3',5'-bis(diphosphate) 3'-pyrophosphohydrolase MESH1 [Strongyloides ratti]CEF62494.1 Guanosine-3',5'-bis(diphosphate) 3'-pyrophosphohydrolase MESH1 [Strongyloides ratti]
MIGNTLRGLCQINFGRFTSYLRFINISSLPEFCVIPTTHQREIQKAVDFTEKYLKDRHHSISEANVYNPKVLIAAILHDVLQDNMVTKEQIVKEFGEDIAKIVEECTVYTSQSKSHEQEDQKLIANSINNSLEARLVLFADRLTNLKLLEQIDPEKWKERDVVNYYRRSYRLIHKCKDTNEIMEEKIRKICQDKFKTLDC